MGTLTGTVGIVTGGGSGIGQAIAAHFAAEGACTVIADINAEDGERTAQEIKANGGEALFVRTDVTRGADVRTMVNSAVETFGRLDWAVNNAGVDGAFMPTADYSEEEWDRVVTVNLRSVFLCLKHELPKMIAGGGGSIINIGSVLGLGGQANQPAYVAAKHGVVGLTRGAALEYAASGVRINALCPGAVRTPLIEKIFDEMPEFEEQIVALHPVGRIASSMEVAAAALWLASDQASFVTGVALPVDGGWRAQ